MHAKHLRDSRTAEGWLRPFAVGALVCMAWQSQAQPSEATRDELQTLIKQVQQLKIQQRKMLEEMEEIKRLVVTSSAVPRSVEAQVAANGPSATEVKDELFRGNPSATVVIIEYADFECPYCRGFEKDTYPQIRDAYIQPGKVRYYFRDLPLQIHPFSLSSARAARCAMEQGKFWEMHDELLSGEVQLTPSDIDQHAKTINLDLRKIDACIGSDRYTDSIRSSVQDAGKMGIRGTPTFLIGNLDPNGSTVAVKSKVVGAQSFGDFKAVLDPLLGAPSAPDAQARN